jgi:SAM-dependent methyltransferase
MVRENLNERARRLWLQDALSSIPAGQRILDAGAGELRNRPYCVHLNYVSQDFCQYDGQRGGAIQEGLQNAQWDTSRIDVVSDITGIPLPDGSFDAILCSEVLEHVPEPTHALDEFERLLRPGGKLILTAPFASMVHMAPYHFCSGFSRYWYEHHLQARGFAIEQLVPNGDWYAFLEQEIGRLGGMERAARNWAWPLAYLVSFAGRGYLRLRARVQAADLATFGWHCVATKAGQ